MICRLCEWEQLPFSLREQAKGGSRRGSWSTHHLKIQHMLTFLYCHSKLHDLLNSCKLMRYKCVDGSLS